MRVSQSPDCLCVTIALHELFLRMCGFDVIADHIPTASMQIQYADGEGGGDDCLEGRGEGPVPRCFRGQSLPEREEGDSDFWRAKSGSFDPLTMIQDT